MKYILITFAVVCFLSTIILWYADNVNDWSLDKYMYEQGNF